MLDDKRNESSWDITKRLSGKQIQAADQVTGGRAAEAVVELDTMTAKALCAYITRGPVNRTVRLAYGLVLHMNMMARGCIVLATSIGERLREGNGDAIPTETPCRATTGTTRNRADEIARRND